MQSQIMISGIAIFSMLRPFNFGGKICARNSGLLSGGLSYHPSSFWDSMVLGLVVVRCVKIPIIIESW